MRKELVYSLLAVAAGPTVPVTVNAAVVPTGAVQDENWSGADKVTSGTVYVSTGNPISCDLGTLAIGKYQLIIGTFSNTTDIKVDVEGVSKTLKATDGKGTVTFVLTEEKQVSFTITPTTTANCEISGVTLSLDANFEGIASTLMSLYTEAYNAVKTYGYYTAGDKTEYNQIYSQIGAITAIAGVKDNDENAYEKVYKAYELWKDVEETDIYKTIVSAKQTADTKEIAYQAGKLEESLASTKEKLDAEETPPYAKNGTLDDYTTSNGKKGLTAKYEDLVAQTAAYKAGSEVTGYSTIDTEISALYTNITAAQNAGTSNYNAYKDVKQAIATAQSTYNTEYTTITTVTIPITPNANLKITDINETLRENAKEELQKQLDAIGEVNQANEEAYAAGTSETYKTAGDYTTKLTNAKTAIETIKKNYTTHVSKLAAAYASYNTEFTKVTTAKTKNKVAIEKNGEGVAEAVTKMEDALAAIAAAIKANESADKIDDLNLTSYGSETKTNLIQAVEDAITALNTVCQDITDNETANTEMTTALNTWNTTLTNNVKAINEAKTGNYDPLAGGYAADYAYVQKLGTDLAAAIKTAYEAGTAKTYQASEAYTTASSTYNTAISNLNTAITADQSKYQAVYNALTAAHTAYNSLLAKVEKLIIYTSTKAETVYSKAWMNAELKKITDIEAVVTAALALTDGCAAIKVNEEDTGAHQTAMQALNASDVTTITNEITAKNVDNDIATAESTYKAQLAQDALDLMASTVNDQLADQNTRLTTIETKATASAYGLTNSYITTEASRIRTEYAKLDTSNPADGTYDGEKTLEALSAALEAIKTNETALSDLEKIAESALAKVKANNDALDVLKAKVNALQSNYNTQKAEADKDYTNSSANWTAAFTAAQNAINALYKDDAIVDTDVKKSYNAETLQESDYKAKITAIEALITKASEIAAYAEENYKANAALNSLYTEVQTAINTANTKASTADNTAYNNFYKNEFDENTAGSYPKALAAIKVKIDAAKTLDNQITTAYPNLKDNMSAGQQDAITKELNDLKDAVEKVEDAVKANLAAYDKQKLALNGDGGENVGARSAFDEVNIMLSTKDETTDSKTWKEEMTGYNDQLIKLEAAVEDYYKKGQSQTTGEDKEALTEVINDLKNKILVIKAKIEGEEYIESIQKDNEAKRDEIRQAVKAAKQAFKDATEYTDKFKNLTSELFSAAITAADNAAPTLNTALQAFPTQIETAAKKAEDDFSEVNAKPQVWDYAADLKAVTDLTDGINSALSTYKTAIKNGIDETYTTKKTGYDKKLSDGKTAIANFTLDDTKLEATAVDKFFEDVITLIGDIDEAYQALDVAQLDKLAKKADTNLATMIAADETNAADAVIRPLITACDQIVTDGQANLTGIDLETFNTEVETYQTNKNTYNTLFAENGIVSNEIFKTHRNNINNFKTTNTYTKTLAIDETYAQLQALIKEREEALVAATTEIEKYAAAGDMKKGVLATIQKSIDDFKATVEGKKGKDEIKNLINAKKDGSTNNDDNETLQGIDTSINKALTTDLKTAEGNYLTAALNNVTSAIFDLEENAGDDEETKTQIATFKDKVQNAETGIQTRLTADINNAEKTAADLLAYEKEIADLLAEINAANKVDNSAIVDELNGLVAAVEDKISLSSYDETIQQSLAEAKQDIQAKLDAVKANISASENIVFDKDKIKDTIAAIDKEADALVAQAEAAQAKAEANQTALDTAIKKIETLETALADAKARLDDTNQYAYVSSTTFKAKLAQIEKSIADVKAAAEAAAAAGTASAFITDNDAYTKPTTKAGTDITDILDSAAKRELKAVAEKLRADIDAITYNESDYTDGDLQDIKNRITTVDGKVGKDSYYDEENKKTVAATGLFATALAETDANLDNDKKTAAGYAQEIADINELIKSQSNEQPDKRGHISSSDEEDITSDDILDLVDIILDNDKLKKADLERCDMDGNQKVDVTDLVWLRYYYVHGKWPTPGTSARTKSADGASMDVTTVSTTDAITRVAINLENSIGFQAIQMDVNLPEGAILRDKSLGERVTDADLLAANKDTGTIRMMILSNDNKAISGSEGPVLYLDIENLQGAVTLSNVTLTDTQYRSHSLSDDPTAIERIKNTVEAAGRTIYNLGGKLMDGLKKGINIIRNADGSTKKVVVK